MIRLLLWERNPVRFGLPTRQQFAVLYRFLRQYPKIANYRQQQPVMARSLQMPVEQLNWMITVFYEAKFVTINDGVLKLADHPDHVDLEQRNAIVSMQLICKAIRCCCIATRARCENTLLTG